MKYTILDNKTYETIETKKTSLSIRELCGFFEFNFKELKKSKFGLRWYVIGSTQTIVFEIHWFFEKDSENEKTYFIYWPEW